MTKFLAAAATMVVAFSIAVAPAGATDAQLRSAIKAADQATQPDATAWAQAIKSNQSTATVRAATQKLITDLKNERTLLSKVKASSAKGRKGKALYLGALNTMRSALKAFDKALTGAAKGNKAKVRTQLKKFQAKVVKSQLAAKRAEKLIGA